MPRIPPFRAGEAGQPLLTHLNDLVDLANRATLRGLDPIEIRATPGGSTVSLSVPNLIRRLPKTVITNPWIQLDTTYNILVKTGTSTYGPHIEKDNASTTGEGRAYYAFSVDDDNVTALPIDLGATGYVTLAFYADFYLASLSDPAVGDEVNGTVYIDTIDEAWATDTIAWAAQPACTQLGRLRSFSCSKMLNASAWFRDGYGFRSQSTAVRIARSSLNGKYGFRLRATVIPPGVADTTALGMAPVGGLPYYVPNAYYILG